MAVWAGRAALRAVTWAGATDEELLADLAAKSAGQASILGKLGKSQEVYTENSLTRQLPTSLSTRAGSCAGLRGLRSEVPCAPGRTPEAAPHAAGQAACKACEAAGALSALNNKCPPQTPPPPPMSPCCFKMRGMWKASLKVQLSGRAAGAAAQQIGLSPDKADVEHNHSNVMSTVAGKSAEAVWWFLCACAQQVWSLVFFAGVC